MIKKGRTNRDEGLQVGSKDIKHFSLSLDLSLFLSLDIDIVFENRHSITKDNIAIIKCIQCSSHN